MGSGGQTTQQKILERRQIERDRQLTVDRQRAQGKAFADELAFRKKLRGFYTLLSAGFKGFPKQPQQTPQIGIKPQPVQPPGGAA